MALTLAEGFADIAPFIAFADKAKGFVDSIPPKATAKPSDYMKAVAAIINEAASLADVLADQIKS